MATREEYLKALRKLKGRDRVGLAGEVAATGVGVAAGAAGSTAIAGAFGASTLLGSSTLGSLVGGVFVTTTPIGWVIGSALAAGAIGYGISKACSSGGSNDQIRRETARAVRTRLQACEEVEMAKLCYDDFIDALDMAMSTGVLDPEKSDKLIRLVDEEKMDVQTATKRVTAMIDPQSDTRPPA